MVLVSILGDFHSSILPLFFNFKDKITKHILVYDDFKRDVNRAKEIQKGFLAFKSKYNYKFKLDKYIVDEDSQEALQKCAKYILSKSKKPENIFINTTDGFSTLTTVLNHELYQKGVNFIAYDMFDNEYNILNTQGIKKEKISNNLNIKDHFILKGYEIEEKDCLKEFANKYEFSIKQLFEKYHALYNKFLQLNCEKYPTVNSLPETMDSIKIIFEKMGLSKYKKSNAFLTGGLFELYIYNIVKNLNYDDIEIGLIIKRNYASVSIPNEFDIFIMKDNHLNMIECKYLNKIDKEALVYKYIALSNIIDEDGSMIIVTKNNSFSKNNLSTTEKRGRLSNIVFIGEVHKNPLSFNIQVKSIFKL